MKKIQYLFGTILMVMIFSGTLICSASSNQSVSEKDMLLFVVDNSKESYNLQNEVFSQLNSQLKATISERSELQHKSDDLGFTDISRVEQPELLKLANETDSNQILIIEILPVKTDFDQILFYNAIKAESTLKIRLYDAGKKQYILAEDASGIGVNKTYIPYSSVGKKGAVMKAVNKAIENVVQKVNDKTDNLGQYYQNSIDD